MPNSVFCDTCETVNAIHSDRRVQRDLFRLGFQLQEEHVVVIISISLDTEETMLVLNNCREALALRIVSEKVPPSFLVKLWAIPFFLSAANVPHLFLLFSCFSCAANHSMISQLI